MNRCLLLALVTAVAVTADNGVYDKAFEPGSEYSYHYEVVTTSSIRAANHQISGLKIRVEVHLQITDDKVVMMQLATPELCKVNQEVPSTETVETVFEHSCTPLTLSEHNAITEQLVKPFKFEWEFGIPSTLHVETDESYWSVNIKRGLVNMFTLNLKERDAIPDVSPEIRDVILTNEPHAADEPHRLFRSFEQDLVGECETIYEVNEEEATGDVFVKKVRNYDNCKTKPFLRNGLLTAFEDIYPEIEENTALKTFSHADYRLKGTRNQYIIKEAHLTSHFSFQAIKEIESAYTATSQRLTLMTVTPETSPLMLSDTLKDVPALKMDLPLELPLANQVPAEVPAMDTPKVAFLKNKVSDLLGKVTEHASQGVDNTDTFYVAGIVSILKELPITTIEEILTSYVYTFDETNELEYKKKELILDLLPTLTRFDMVPLIRNLLKENIISAPRAAVMLNMMVMTVKPNPKTFEDLMVLFRDPLMAEHTALKRIVLSSSGILANKLKNMFADMYVDRSVSTMELHTIAQELISLLENSDSMADKMEVFAAFGNAGLLELVPEIEKFLKDPATLPELKPKAIFSLRKIAPAAPKLVQTILLPFYSDNAQLPFVRISSFLMLMKTNPSAGVLQLLTHELKTDCHVDVLTFVMSYLRRMSQSEDPKLHDMAMKVKVALRDIEDIKGGFANSAVYSMEQYIETLGPIGADLKLEVLNMDQTPLPTNIAAHLSMALFGKKFEVAEFGFVNKGLKDFFWNLMGPVNRFDDIMAGRFTPEDFFLPLSELVSKILGGVENIKNKFATTGREMLSEKILHLYMKLCSYELWTVHLQDQEIIDTIKEVSTFLPQLVSTMNSGYPVRLLKTLSLPDAAVTLPTPCGLPMSINITSIAMLNVNGHFRLEGMGSLFALFNKPAPVVSVITDLDPSLATSTYLTMCTHLPHVRNTALVNVDFAATIPVKKEFILDLAERKFTYAIEPPHTTMTFAKLHMSALTTSEIFPITPITEYPIMDFIKVMGPVRQYTTAAWGEGLQLPVQIEAEYPYAFSPLQPRSYFVGPTTIEFKFLAPYGAPEKLELEMQYVPFGMERTIALGHERSTFSSWLPFSFRESPRDITSLDFDNIPIMDDEIDLSTTRTLFAVARTVGGDVEKQSIVKLCNCYDPTYTKFQINMQFLSSPLLAKATHPIKIVANALITIPEFFYKFAHDAPIPTEGPQLFYQADIKYGFTDTVQPFTVWKMFYRREAELSTPALLNAPATFNQNPITLSMKIPHMYRDISILEGIANATLHGKLYFDPHPNLPLELINEFEYDFETLPAAFKFALPVLQHYALKFPYFLNKDAITTLLPFKNEARKLKFITIFDPLLDETTQLIETPSKTFTAHGLPLPFQHIFKNAVYTPTLPKLLTDLLYGDIPAGLCSVTPDNYVHLYDLLSIKLPQDQCEVVLAKDCSPLNLFLVTMKATPTGTKIVNLYLPNNKLVEVLPTETAVRVLVNGEPITLPTDGSMYYIDEHTSGTDTTGRLYFLPKFNGVLIFSLKYGLMLETDGHQVSFKPAEFYRRQTCGLCGNFDSSLYEELEAPSGDILPSHEQFLTSFTIPTPGCEVPYISSLTCEHVLRNIVFERYIDDEQKICISTEPVSQCTGHCEPEVAEASRKSFHCLPAYLSSAQRLREDVLAGPMHLTSVEANLYENVTEHYQCTRTR